MRDGEKRSRDGPEAMAKDMHGFDLMLRPRVVNDRKNVVAHLPKVGAITAGSLTQPGTPTIHRVNRKAQPSEKRLGLHEPTRMALQTVQHDQRSSVAAATSNADRQLRAVLTRHIFHPCLAN